MALLVNKFGGTSVGGIDRIEGVADLVAADHAQGHSQVVVVSAMAGETDRLVALADAISTHGRPNPRELDVLLATGEQVTIALLSMALEKRGITARSYTGRQAGIRTDSAHSRARIQNVETATLKSDIERGRVPVVAGFQGETESGDITTLGRGGSDTTAVALAAALRASECRIFTDVDGVYTADPRLVPEARRLDEIGFEAMLEMAGQGSKVLQIRAVEFARKHKVPLRVLSTFEPGPGTCITLEEAGVESAQITGIAHRREEAEIRLRGLPGVPETAWRVLAVLADASIEVDMMVQNLANDGRMDFTFTVDRRDYWQARELLRQLLGGEGVQIEGHDRVAKVSLVGAGVRSHAGIAAKMLQCLSQSGILVRLISTSQVRVSVLVEEDVMAEAVRKLHAAFGLSQA